MGSNPPVEIAAWLACLAFVVMLIKNGLSLVDRIKDKPPAHEVRAEAATTYSTKVELKDHVIQDFQEHSNLWSKIGGMERGLTQQIQEMERRLNTQDEERTQRVHTRLDEILGDMREMRGEMKANQAK